jgi:hypothetical protein
LQVGLPKKTAGRKVNGYEGCSVFVVAFLLVVVNHVAHAPALGLVSQNYGNLPIARICKYPPGV